MCGRFEQHIEWQQGWTELLKDWPWSPRHNLKPTQAVGTVDAHGFQERQWWLVPPWASSPQSRYPTFNARAETLAEKPSFRRAWAQSQRCIVPASRYFEWALRAGVKQCHAVEAANGEPLLLAGLWERWRGDDSEIHSCTIVTVPASSDMAELHPRMPLILRTAANADEWLHADVDTAAKQLQSVDASLRVKTVDSPEPDASQSGQQPLF